MIARNAKELAGLPSLHHKGKRQPGRKKRKYSKDAQEQDKVAECKHPGRSLHGCTLCEQLIHIQDAAGDEAGQHISSEDQTQLCKRAQGSPPIIQTGDGMSAKLILHNYTQFLHHGKQARLRIAGYFAVRWLAQIKKIGY
jgi:hypothetical protein